MIDRQSSSYSRLSDLRTLDSTAESHAAPACLPALELEDYIHLRIECGLKTGDYWAQLYANKYTDEQLALLRYYDYLDTSTPMQPVAVYRCTELALLGKH